MKILAIGDPHGALDKIKKISIKDIDLILITGDMGSADEARKFCFNNYNRVEKGLPKIELTNSLRKKFYMEIYKSSMKILRYLSKKAPVYFIYGNAEYYTSDIRKLSKKIGEELPFVTKDLKKIKGVRVINNRVVNFKEVKIGGLEYFVDNCWIDEFKVKDKKKIKEAKKDTLNSKKKLRSFNDIDILLCHQPPYGVLDKVGFKGAPKHWLGKHAGSKVILDYIRKKHPKYVLCGHIHEAEGIKKVGKTKVYNLGVSGSYQVINIK